MLGARWVDVRKADRKHGRGLWRNRSIPIRCAPGMFAAVLPMKYLLRPPRHAAQNKAN